MADGKLNFDTSLDTSAFEAGIGRIESLLSQLLKELRNVGSAITGLPPVEITADTSQVEQAVDEVKQSVESIPDESIVVNAETEPAEQAINDIPPLIDNVGNTADQVGKEMTSDFRTAGKSMESAMDSSAAHIAESLEAVKSGFKKVMAAAGIAFSAGAVVAFGKKALESSAEINAANSQLAQTFGTLQTTAEAAMKRVADESGIVQTRLQGVGTSIYAFAKTSGMDSAQALGMMEDALKVAADSAAYYDKSLEETSETLKSFLKGNYANDAALGLSATETTRNAAANKMYAKSFQELSEAQKQMVLLQMVKDANALSGAEGQAAREADNWENVLGNLKEAWRQLLAVVGQPILKAATIIVQQLTAALLRLVEVAKAAAQVFADLTGWDGFKAATTSTQAISSDISQSVANQNALTDAVEETAEAEKKSLAGFDKINTLSSKSEDSKSESDSEGVPALATMGGEIPAELTVDTSKAVKAIEKFVKTAQKLLKRVRDYITKNFGGIFKNIWGGLVTETEKLYGIIAGIFADIKTLGPDLANWFSGDFTSLLQTSFAVIGDILTALFEDFNMVFSDIWNVAVFPCLSAFIEDGLPMITQFAEQTVLTLGVMFDEINKMFKLLWEGAAKPILTLVAKIFSDVMESFKKCWDEWGAPIFEKLRTAIQKTGELFRAVWNSFLKPVFDAFMSVADELWTNHLKPLLDNILDLVGMLISAALDIYNKVLAPILTWVVQNIGPKIAAYIGEFAKTVGRILGGVVDAINGIITALKGVVTFLTGVFSGDWEKAWKGIKDIFKGIWDALASLVKIPLQAIINAINKMLGLIEDGINAMIGLIDQLYFDAPDWVEKLFGIEGFGFDVDPIEIPKIPELAQGTVVPANYGEFLAVLGDNKREAEVVSPLSTIKQAVREAMGEGGSGPKELVIYTYLFPNSAAFHREVVKIVEDDRSRKGGVR